MSAGERVRAAAFALFDPDDPASIAGRARARRWDEFTRRFSQPQRLRILDLGGTPRFWRAAPFRPEVVTIVNLVDERCEEPWIETVVGDACDPPVEGSFDLVFSNSLIEHLPGIDARRRFAEAVRRSAGAYWVQTPNRYFPIEPHWLFPGAQFLGRPARTRLARNWPPSHFSALPDEVIATEVENIDLLSRGTLAELFPDAEIWSERAVAMTKSLVAVRQ